MTLNFEWAKVTPNASSNAMLDLTDAEPVPQDKLDEFTSESGSVNTRGLGKAIRRESGDRFCIKTIKNHDDVEDGIYVLSVEHNPGLKSKPKSKRGSRRK